MKGLIEGELSLSLNPWPKSQLSLSKFSKFMAKNPAFSLSKFWPKTQPSLSKPMAKNPALSLSLNLWLFVVSNLGFCSLIWDLSFVFGFLESLR